MSAPDISILLPTRGRPETFGAALATALAQDHSAIEVVVQNNGADPATRALVEAARDPRIAYDETPAVLSMTDNWERALRRARGRWVTVLGDDDGLMADACRIVYGLAAADPELAVISWAPADYGWDSDRSHLRNRLAVKNVLDADRREMTATADLFDRALDLTLSFLDLPMAYNGFVAARLIRTAQSRWGRYFGSVLPDVHSGLVNLLLADRYLRLHRPLSVRGTSGQSVGAAFTRHAEGAARRAAFEAESGGGALWQPGLFPSANLAMVIANSLMGSVRILRPEVGPGRVDPARVLALMAATIGHAPDGYDATLADARRLAEMHGLTVDWSQIPPRPPPLPPAAPGLWRAGDVSVLVVDCAQQGIRTVADAVAYAARVLPEWRG